MEKIRQAVTDTGPLMHLHELKLSRLFSQLVKQTITTPQVFEELTLEQQEFYGDSVLLEYLKENQKDNAYVLTAEYELHLAEATAIMLAKSKNVPFFFTDDLAARTVAKKFGLQPHGTLGILLRGYRDSILTQEQTINALSDLRKTSLFITTSLIHEAIREVRSFDICAFH